MAMSPEHKLHAARLVASSVMHVHAPGRRMVAGLTRSRRCGPGFELYGERAITTALRSLGYKRIIRPRRIYLTDRHKANRVAFAYEQLALRPRPEDWERVLFSDETWATNSNI